MSETEEMETANGSDEHVESDGTSPTKRSAVIKRQKELLDEKKDADELEEELGGVDDPPEENEEDSDQEYTTKKKKPVKKIDPVVDPVFQSRLVSATRLFDEHLCKIRLGFRTKIKLNDSTISWSKQRSSRISFKMVN